MRCIKKRAIFLDLQGTLGGDPFGSILDFSFYPFSKNAIKTINQSSFLCILITNQSWIGKGLFTLDQFYEKLDLIKASMKDESAYFDAVYCCPHTREFGCTCKKPLTGMIDCAQKEFDILLQDSYLIGDMGISDMVLADKMKIKSILVLTGAGKSSLQEYRHTWKDVTPSYICSDVLEAVNLIMNRDDK